jgi:hypothetical protein
MDHANAYRFRAGLAAFGVTPPGFDEAWLAYRCWLLWGLMIWLFNSTDFHSESACTVAASRFGAAMIDHDVFRLLGV